MEETKDFSKAPESYHWAFFIFIYLFMYLFIYLFIYSFSVNKVLLTTANNNFLQFNYFKIFLTYRSSPQEMFIWRGVFCVCTADSWGAYPRVSVISIKLKSEIALLRRCSTVGLLCLCGECLFDSTSIGLLLNKRNFLYNF